MPFSPLIHQSQVQPLQPLSISYKHNELANPNSLAEPQQHRLLHYQSSHLGTTNVHRALSIAHTDSLQVGGPSRGTRFRPLSLDVPKVCPRRHTTPKPFTHPETSPYSRLLESPSSSTASVQSPRSTRSERSSSSGTTRRRSLGTSSGTRPRPFPRSELNTCESTRLSEQLEDYTTSAMPSSKAIPNASSSSTPMSAVRFLSTKC